MSDPVVFRVLRPYQNLEEFLEAEAHWLQRKTMLVFGGPDLAPDTVVRFGIDLASGESVIRAEGRVIEYVGPMGETPGALKIRFKRYGASTKSVLDRAEEYRAAAERRKAEDGTLGVMELDLELPSPELGSSPEVNSVPLNPIPEPPHRLSGVHQRVRVEVQAPDNRDELLEKLRQRATARSPVGVSNVPPGKAL